MNVSRKPNAFQYWWYVFLRFCNMYFSDSVNHISLQKTQTVLTVWLRGGSIIKYASWQNAQCISILMLPWWLRQANKCAPFTHKRYPVLMFLKCKKIFWKMGKVILKSSPKTFEVCNRCNISPAATAQGGKSVGGEWSDTKDTLLFKWWSIIWDLTGT